MKFNEYFKCYSKNHPNRIFDGADYICWIQEKHRKFKEINNYSKHYYSKIYEKEFLDWLKTY